ncbi:MAG: hypothetical protein OXE83_11455 [Gammaproteobacteria bacterium]|nr:hypothetical protein [Gammaproteobacteria bacterium]
MQLATQRHGGAGTLHSEVLGLTFRQFGKEVRLMDPATGKDLPTHDELLRTQRVGAARTATEIACRRAAEERQRAAEARIAGLEALLARQRAEP